MTTWNNSPSRGAVAFPPDSYYDPCESGHSSDVYRDDKGAVCCRRCGDVLHNASWR